eukprot:107603_1
MSDAKDSSDNILLKIKSHPLEIREPSEADHRVDVSVSGKSRMLSLNSDPGSSLTDAPDSSPSNMAVNMRQSGNILRRNLREDMSGRYMELGGDPLKHEVEHLRRIIICLAITCVCLIAAVFALYMSNYSLLEKETNSAFPPWMDGATESTFMTLSDVHYDPFYNETVSAKTFCRSINQESVTTAAKAEFGRQKCDSPLKLIQSTLAKMAEVNPSPDFILIPGDLIAHHPPLGSNPKDELFGYLDLFSKEIRKKFRNTPVLIAFGNNDYVHHDRSPKPHSEFTNRTATLWKGLIGSEQTCDFDNLEYGLFYSCKIGSSLRVISLNTVLLMPGEPNNTKAIAQRQFEWLGETLQKIVDEGKNGRALIFGHVPPVVGPWSTKYLCAPEYISQLTGILSQYRAQITGLVFAHTHQDDIDVIYSTEKEPLTALFSLPAVAPSHGDTNPGFRIFSYRRSDLELMNYKQFSLDIERANTPGQPLSFGSYEFRRSFQTEVVSPTLNVTAINRVAHAIAHSHALSATYLGHRTGMYSTPAYRITFIDCTVGVKPRTEEEFAKCVNSQKLNGGVWN